MAEPIIEKLRKLLALADEDSGATDGEREAAAARAAKLMAKYDIDRSEIGSADDQLAGNIGAWPWRRITRDEAWIQMLATAVAVGLGNTVEVLAQRCRDTDAIEHAVFLLGSEVKTEFVARITDYLIPQLTLECEAALLRRKEQYAERRSNEVSLAKQLREEADSRGLGRFMMGPPEPMKPWSAGDTKAFRQAFLKTAAQRLRWRVKEAYDAATEEAGTGTELVLSSERDELDEFIEEHGIKTEQRRAKISSREGQVAGHQAAAKVDVMPGSKVGQGGKYQLTTSGAGWPE